MSYNTHFHAHHHKRDRDSPFLIRRRHRTGHAAPSFDLIRTRSRREACSTTPVYPAALHVVVPQPSYPSSYGLHPQPHQPVLQPVYHPHPHPAYLPHLPLAPPVIHMASAPPNPPANAGPPPKPGPANNNASSPTVPTFAGPMQTTHVNLTLPASQPGPGPDPVPVPAPPRRERDHSWPRYFHLEQGGDGTGRGAGLRVVEVDGTPTDDGLRVQGGPGRQWIRYVYPDEDGVRLVGVEEERSGPGEGRRTWTYVVPDRSEVGY